MVLGFPPAV
jgi:hypothetical protein